MDITVTKHYSTKTQTPMDSTATEHYCQDCESCSFVLKAKLLQLYRFHYFYAYCANIISRLKLSDWPVINSKCLKL